MTKINSSADCGNSPKNQFAEKLSVALAIGDAAFVSTSVTDTVQWALVGKTVWQGKAAVTQALVEWAEPALSEITIHHVATHGKIGAVNGTFRQRAGTVYEFCHVYEFSNTKASHVQTITSYVIAQA